MTAQQAPSEAVAKQLKRLGYPEVQEAAKPSSLLARAKLACTKRMKKLEELLPEKTDPAAQPSQPQDPAKSPSAISKDALTAKPTPYYVPCG